MKRNVSIALVLAALVGLFIWAMIAQVRHRGHAMVWTMYQREPSHNAVIADNFPAVRWAVNLPKKTNGGFGYDGTALYVDDFAKEVLALNPRNGKVLWRAQTDDVVMSTPVVAEGNVYVGSGTNAIMWDLPRETLWGRPAGNHVYAFNARTGRKVWEYKTRGEAMPTPAYAHSKLFVGTGNNLAIALDAITGRRIWQKTLPGVVTMGGAMPIDDKVVFLSSRGVYWTGAPQRNHTFLLSAKDGKTVWVRPFGNADCTPTIANGTVFIESSEAHGKVRGLNRVRALDLRTGALKWTYETKIGRFTLKGSNERAIAGMYADGALFQSLPVVNEFAAFDAKTGRPLWVNKTSASVKMSGVLKDGRVYYGDTDGMFYVADAKTGHIFYSRRFEKGFTTAPPLIIGETLFVATTNVLHAIPLSDIAGAAA